MEFMLTKNDLKQIDNLVKKNIDVRVPRIIDARVSKIIDARVPKIIKSAFQEFYDSIFEPYVNKNEKEHSEMIGEIKLLRKDTDEIREYVRDHDQRLETLETATSSRN